MTYTGLCIDGPLDGQKAEQPNARMEVEVRSPVPVAPVKDANKLKLADVTTVVYLWHDVKGTGLWLLEGETPAQAVEHMTKKIGVAAIASRYEQVVARQKDDTK